jgi:ABC-type amino acid transport substrate-binding protein
MSGITPWRRIVFGAFAAAVISMAGLSARGEPLRIVSMVLGEHLQERDKPGFYKDLAETILKLSGADFTFRIEPLRRALREFDDGRADCIWALDVPLLRKLGVKVDDLISSLNVLTSTQRVYTLKGKVGTERLEDLHGRIVGVLNGSSIIPELESVSAVIVPLSSQTTKVEMLYRGRLDAIAAWEPDIYATIAALDFDPDAVVVSPYIMGASDIGFVCHPGPGTRLFLNQADAAIRTLRSTSEFRAIADRYGLPLAQR